MRKSNLGALVLILFISTILGCGTGGERGPWTSPREAVYLTEAAQPTPPLQPTSAPAPSNAEIIRYIQGYADGTAGLPPVFTSAATQPTVPPVPLPPVPPPVTQPTTLPVPPVVVVTPPGRVPDGTDLAPLIEQQASGTELILVEKGHYKISRTMTCPARIVGAGIEAHGSTITLAPSAGTPAVFINRSTHYWIVDAIIDGQNIPDLVAFRDYGDSLVFVGCEFKNINGNAIWTDKDANLKIQTCKFGVTGSNTLYITGGGSLVDSCYLAGAVGEYPIRYTCSNDGTHLNGGTLSNCYIRKAQNFDKDTVGVRLGDNVKIINCTIEGNVRIGETAVPTACKGTVFWGNTIYNTRPTMYGVAVYGGEGTITNNKFLTSGTDPKPGKSIPAIGVGNGAKVTATGNTLVHPPGTFALLFGANNFQNVTVGGTLEDTSKTGNTPPVPK